MHITTNVLIDRTETWCVKNECDTCFHEEFIVNTKIMEITNKIEILIEVFDVSFKKKVFDILQRHFIYMLYFLFNS